MTDAKLVKGYISTKGEIGLDNNLNNGKFTKLIEASKATVLDKEVRFPKGLGAEHPFDFEKLEKISNNVGIINSGVNKITDAIVGDFTIKVSTEQGQKAVDEFVKVSGLTQHLRPWVKEGVLKGNGFMDLSDLSNLKLRTLNANRMYIKRKKSGEIIKYNQFNGNTLTYVVTEDNVKPFDPSEIAHLPINENPDDPYGQGLVYANLKSADFYASAELSLAQLQARKAGMPIHAKIGQPGESVNPDDIDQFKVDLQFMNNKTEWVTDGNIDMKVIDFKDVGRNSIDAAEHTVEQLAMGMQIPLAVWGKANISEGIAKTNEEGFQRMIGSIRIRIEDLIENKILTPFLKLKKIKADVEFVWSMPGEEEKNLRLTAIQSAMSSPLLSPELRAALEKEYAEVLGLQDVISELPTPQEARKEADKDKKEQAKAQMQPKFGQSEEPKIIETVLPVIETHTTSVEIGTGQSDGTIISPALVVAKADESKDTDQPLQKEIVIDEEALLNAPLNEYLNLKEANGLSYSDYLAKVLQVVRTDKFKDLAAENSQQVLEGLFPKLDVEKLRIILKDGFRRNKSIRDIEKDIAQSINIKDRLQKDGEDYIITAKAEIRPNMIARTETIRLANLGAKKLFKENDVEKYYYIAALDERTCNICMGLDGKKFNVNESVQGVNMPPMHVNCRCSMAGII